MFLSVFSVALHDFNVNMLFEIGLTLERSVLCQPCPQARQVYYCIFPFNMATVAETLAMEFAAKVLAVELGSAMEEQPVEASEILLYEPQHVVPTSYIYDA